jgi:hypothetical protein
VTARADEVQDVRSGRALGGDWLQHPPSLPGAAG